ncbi:MAG: dipeptidase [Thermaerobacter sp.]|nr:dipeptidase [Thermaerobacter sp.]
MLESLEGYLQAERGRQLEELLDFLRIESVSAQSAHGQDMARAAGFVAADLRRTGFDRVEVLATGGHPVVWAEHLPQPGGPTVLIYGHYDVQPPDPLERWHTPPFVPDLREGRIYARGASDDKGPLFIALKALEALRRTAGELPLNVRCLIEGEEELGSIHLEPFVAAHHEMLQADLVLSADGAMWRASEPSLTLAAKGLCGVEVRLWTANQDLHSGRHGGGVPNALHVLAELVAGLHDALGRVTVEGFYDRVRNLTAAERTEIATLDFDEEAYRGVLGLGELWGEEGYSTLERQWARPTLELNGMGGGYQGEGGKTVVPSEAMAKITCRIVPDQDPDEIRSLLQETLLRRTPPYARIEVAAQGGSSNWYRMPPDHPVLALAGEVLQEVTGRGPVRVRMGGTEPCADLFQRELGVSTLFYSFSTADEQYHAPNEFFRLERFDQGLRAWAILLAHLPEVLGATDGISREEGSR